MVAQSSYRSKPVNKNKKPHRLGQTVGRCHRSAAIFTGLLINRQMI